MQHPPTPEEPEYIAIEITSPDVAKIITALTTSVPYTDFDYEKYLRGNFLILDFPAKGDHTLMKAGDMGGGTFDHIEPYNKVKIKLVKFILR